jgi:DNA-binding MarR family transcriptional regulator
MDDRLLFLLSRTGYALKNYIKREFEKDGIHLSSVDMGILFSLKMSGSLRMNQISRIVSVDGAAITRHVDMLEKDGYVKREPSLEDRRAINIRLTEKGASEAEKCNTVVQRINASIKEKFSSEDIAVFMKVLGGLLSKYEE